MRLIDTLRVPRNEGVAEIQLLVGDLSAIPAEHSVDALVVSAFAGDYTPVPNTLIGALYEKRGLWVSELATDKEVDLRDVSSCWLSRPLDRADLNFRHLLCWEPGVHNQAPPDAVGDVFRSLFPYVAGEPWISSVALPLLAAGNQGADPLGMLRAILEAAYHWLRNGLPLRILKIVVFERDSALIDGAAEVFAGYSRELQQAPQARAGAPGIRYDLFVSYSRLDQNAVDDLVARIRVRNPGMRIYLDRAELDAGSPWQQGIFEAIDASRRILCLYSPDYLESRVCLEEYNIAHLRHREEGDVLVPAYLRTAPKLPTFMRLIQYVDVRENDPGLLEALAEKLATGVGDASPGVPLRARQDGAQSPRRADAGAELAGILGALTSTDPEVKFEVTVRRIPAD